MSQAPASNRETREQLAQRVAALRIRLPVDPATQLIDFATAQDSDLKQFFELAQGLLAVVVLHVQYDVAYRADGPPKPLTGLDGRVLAHAGEVARSSVRATDLVMRTGPLDLALVLLGAGPLQARELAGRLRPILADQRFEEQGYEVRWWARLGLATHQLGSRDPSPSRVLSGLFEMAV